MALDIEKLIADTQAARAATEAQKAKADSAAAALNLSKKANKDTLAKVANQLNYANALSQTIADMEAKLTAYATSIGRGDTLGPGDQKEFDTLLVQYKSTDKTYQKTIKEVNTVLAKAPSPTSVEVKGGKAQVAPIAEEIAVKTVDNKGGIVEPKPEDFAGLLKTAPKFIRDMSGPERKILAASLNEAFGSKIPVVEVYTDALSAAYQQAISGAQARYNQFKDILTVQDFLNEKKLETAAIKAAGGDSKLGKLPEPSTNILAPTEAAAKIASVIKSELGREATPKEIKALTVQLNAAQRDPKNAQRSKRNKSGVIEYSGGIEVGQWLTDKIKALPEYAEKLQAKQDLTSQSIETILKSNGVPYKPEQVKAYANRVKNGEAIENIANEIRTAASFGQPDSVKKLLASGTDLETLYAPYKRVMSSSLGVNPDTITLDDPTLRMAIGPDKEMSLYDYKKAIRTDKRWKYSQEANDEVTNMINQVKRDFGFMG